MKVRMFLTSSNIGVERLFSATGMITVHHLMIVVIAATAKIAAVYPPMMMMMMTKTMATMAAVNRLEEGQRKKTNTQTCLKELVAPIDLLCIAC